MNCSNKSSLDMGKIKLKNRQTLGCCKVKLTFIGHSGSNCSAFYLYRVIWVLWTLAAPLVMHMCKHTKGCDSCTVKSLPCKTLLLISRFWTESTILKSSINSASLWNFWTQHVVHFRHICCTINRLMSEAICIRSLSLRLLS